jgi:hypothetical protein
LKDAFFATPTKQMLVYHAQETQNQEAHPAPEFDDFFSELEALNLGTGYPSKCRNVSIASGSGNGTGYNFNPGDKLFAINRIFVLLNIITDGWAVPDQTTKKIFSGVATFFDIPTNFTIRKVGNTDPYDNAPGGQGDFVQITIENVGGNLTECKVDPCVQDFIPTKSALDLGDSYGLFTNVMNDITGSDGIAFRQIDYSSLVSPFDAIYVDPANKPHVIGGVTPEIADFICDEIMPEDLRLQNRIVSLPTDFEGIKSITTGFDVTDRYPNGGFIVGSSTGDIRFMAGEEITFAYGTVLFAFGGNSVVAFIKEFPEDCNFECRLDLASNDAPQTEAPIIRPVNSSSIRNYPNPCQGHTHVEVALTDAAPGTMIVDMYDLLGHRVGRVMSLSDAEKGIYHKSIDVSDLSAGIYLCVLRYNGEVVGSTKVQVIK